MCVCVSRGFCVGGSSIVVKCVGVFRCVSEGVGGLCVCECLVLWGV